MMLDIENKLDLARKELLDLTFRNNSINYRLLKAKGVEIEDDPKRLLQALIFENTSLSFLPKIWDEQDLHTEDKNRLVDSSTNQRETSTRNELKIQTVHPDDELQKRLLRTYYDARTYIQEQGVNVLYLVIGMLEWYETKSSPQKHLAPLILIPVELSRSSVNAQFLLKYTGDDLRTNISLQAKLKQDFGLALPELPESLDDMDIGQFFKQILQVISLYDRWTVDENALVLGFFSYGSFLIYNDLDLANWPENNKPTKHPILNALLSDSGFTKSPPSFTGENKRLRDQTILEDTCQIVDADSSQIQAILEVNAGYNMVIQGPPGTGKSQTITNVIAEALNQNKTVLFVAEKMAALEVVKRRLDGLGIGSACIELHSQKTPKKIFLQELEQTLELRGLIPMGNAFEKQHLLELYQRLNGYCDAVNTAVNDSEVTPYYIFGKLLKLEKYLESVSVPEFQNGFIESWSGDVFRRRLEKIRRMELLLDRIGVPSNHNFWGSQIRNYLPSDSVVIQQSVRNAGMSIQQLCRTAKELADFLQHQLPKNRAEVIHLLSISEQLLTAPDLTGINIQHKSWIKEIGTLSLILDAGKKLEQIQVAHDKWLVPEAWECNVLKIRQTFITYAFKWWRMFSGDYRRARNELERLCRGKLPKSVENQIRLLDSIIETQRLRAILQQNQGLCQNLFQSHWQGEESNWSHLAEVIEWVTLAYQEATKNRSSREVLKVLCQQPFQPDDLAKLHTKTEVALEKHLDALVEVQERIQFDPARCNSNLELLEYSFQEQLTLFSKWYRSPERVQDMVEYNHQVDQFCELGLEPLLSVVESWPGSSCYLTTIVERVWYRHVARKAFQHPSLARFSGVTHLADIDQFQKTDLEVLSFNRRHLINGHRQHLSTKLNDRQQLRILKREFAKKRRHLPIRKLIELAGETIQTIKPVFMMSPQSIAQFLSPGAVSFDLVIFDEASQVRPVEAFGALIRGKQAVVVGDQKQLPPTSFFEAEIEIEEELESVTSDLESILTLFLAQNAPERMLRWHYRSRHESLITVSNQEFYNNQLVVFPSPDANRENLGVVFHHLPDATYDRGKSRTNRKEAQAVAKAVLNHAAHHPDLSLGVASFSSSQMQEIQQQLEYLRRQDASCEMFFNNHSDEPFFIKNLENIQGDERDVIFISVGYGRSSDGRLPMNFGPLNREGGERRLNVLITRARQRCEIFSSLSADDIDLTRSQAPGVKAFKTYLKYAETGQTHLFEVSGRAPDSPFEESVAEALTNLGYQVVAQIGVAGFFIDLAVVDKKKPGRYAIGIECDGATYHSARSSRDRDRLRQQVLENLGWRIHRIWSTDWFRDPKRELQHTVDAIELAMRVE